MFPELSGGKLPFGVIFRTASADASEEKIRREYLELSERLARIVQYGTMRSLYSCLYRASDAVPADAWAPVTTISDALMPKSSRATEEGKTDGMK